MNTMVFDHMLNPDQPGHGPNDQMVIGHVLRSPENRLDKRGKKRIYANSIDEGNARHPSFVKASFPACLPRATRV